MYYNDRFVYVKPYKKAVKSTNKTNGYKSIILN